MTLTLDRDGERLDSALSRLVPELTRSQAQRLIEQGAVTQAGRPVKKNEKLPAGTALELEIPEVREAPIAAQDIPLEVCYEDADVIVVNKPKGLVVHPAPGHADGTLVNALLAHCGDSLSGIGGEKRPGIVHRIDKDTSGLIIAAKNDFAHAALAAQLKDHSLARTYVCIVCGKIKDDSGTIDAPIGRHPADRKKMAVTEKNSRSAVTHWRVLERFSGYTLVAVAVRHLEPDLVAGEREDGREDLRHGVENDPQCALCRASGGGIRAVAVQAVFDDIEIEARKRDDAEIVDGVGNGQEFIVLIRRLALDQQLIELCDGPAVERLHTGGRGQLVGIKIGQIVKAELRRVAELEIVLAQLLEDLIGAAHIDVIIRRACPQAADVRAVFLEHVRRIDAVAEGLVHGPRRRPSSRG